MIPAGQNFSICCSCCALLADRNGGQVRIDTAHLNLQSDRVAGRSAGGDFDVDLVHTDNCGDRPENVTSAATPPIRTTGFASVLRCWSPEFAPSAGAASTAPKPVAKMTSPPPSAIFAGRVVKPGMELAGAAMLPSAFTAIACPP